MKTKHYLFISSVTVVAIAHFLFTPTIIGQTDSPPPEEVVVSPPTIPSPISADEATAQLEQEGPPVTIYYADGSAVAVFTKGGITSNVEIHPSETVTIQVAFPAETAGQTVIVQSLDGGSIAVSEDNLTVNSDGIGTLSFTAGTTPGLYRVFVKAGDPSSTIQFWIPIPTDDSATPPLVTPEL